MKFRVLAAACVALGGSIAAAATSPLPTTLDQLVADGSTGITIGDKTFYNFSVQGSVPADAIHVVTPTGSNIGLEFQYNWTSSAGNNLDTLIRYSVHVNDTTLTQQLINGVGLHFDGNATGATLVPALVSAAAPPNTDLGTNATVTETIDDINGNRLGQLTVFNAGAAGTAFNKNDATFVVTPPTRDLMLSKDIQVHSSTSGGGTSTISLVDNTFSQTTNTSSVPLPPAALTALATLGLGAVSPIRRRLRRLI
ncbi:MAG TPA: hypothetical protein VN541_12665 [Tepidisphaeraceae bacterium]|nr:hypothetical protein [Tepidisphaeraceae bacterium]